MAPDFPGVDSGRKLTALIMLAASSPYPFRQPGDGSKSAVNVTPPASSGTDIKRFAVDANTCLGYLTRSPAGVGRCKIEPTVCSRTAITVNNASLVITRHDDRRRSPLLPTPYPSHPGRNMPTLTEVTPAIIDPDSRRQTTDASAGYLTPDATNKERQDAK